MTPAVMTIQPSVSVIKSTACSPLISDFRPPTSEHRSFPRNLLFAEALYLVRYIERYGTGTGDMIRLCPEAGLPEPDFQLTDGFVTIIQRPARLKSTPAASRNTA